MDGDDFEVLTAGFSFRREADAVAARLQESLGLLPGDLDIGELGTAQDAALGLAIVLAGRFHHAVIPVVSDLVERHGGIVLSRVSAARAGARRRAPTSHG